KELISSQNNLRNLSLNLLTSHFDDPNIIPALSKHSNTLTKLHLYGEDNYLPLSFISSFSNLQEIVLSFFNNCGNFEKLQYVTFPKLKIFKIPYICPNPMHII